MQTAYLPKHKALVLSVLDEGCIDVNGYRDSLTGLTLVLVSFSDGHLVCPRESVLLTPLYFLPITVCLFEWANGLSVSAH